MKDLFIFAGEPSGDLHGEKLITALKSKQPDLNIWGVGGPRMRAAGLRSVLSMEEFQVMGFIDVFLALPKLMRHFYFLRRLILEKKPDAAVFIDYPGFNIRLENALRKKGYRGFLCHYICPSVWAWGKKRIPAMAKNLDLLLTILPFEPDCFKGTSLTTRYVGHPLIARIPEAAVKEEVNKLAIFPGSRRKEIERNFPQYVRVAKALLRDFPYLQIAVSLSQEKYKPLLEEIMDKEGLRLPFEQDAYNLMKTADLAIAKSGTITLELALHNIPTVVTYGISKMDLFLAQHIFRIRLPFYCIVNIIQGSEVFPELIGPYLTEPALLEKTKNFLTSKDARISCQRKCQEVRSQLGGKDASEEAARTILNYFS